MFKYCLDEVRDVNSGFTFAMFSGQFIPLYNKSLCKLGIVDKPVHEGHSRMWTGIGLLL